MKNSSTAFCFDLDGTLTTQEMLPLLAKSVHLEDEIEALTIATIKGYLPFEKSFKLRIRLLQDLPIDIAQAVVASVPLHQGVLDFIKNHSDNCFIVTGNLDAYLPRLKKIIPCKFFSSQTETAENRLISIKKILNKANVVKELRTQFSHIVTIGDGMNDAPMFELADTRIAFGAVHKPADTIIKLANYVSFHEKSLCHLLNMLS